MPIKSAGILLYRRRADQVEVLLVHPGGPYWIHRDELAWSIPKGESNNYEDTLAAALCEFKEETGFYPTGEAVPLAPLRQSSGKVIHAYAIEGDLDPDKAVSNRFKVEWPPKSGRWQEFPEVDRAAWFNLADARRAIVKGQSGFLDQLEQILRAA